MLIWLNASRDMFGNILGGPRLGGHECRYTIGGQKK